MLEAENWKIALERYDGHPIPALLLAHQLMAIKQCLVTGPRGSWRLTRRINPRSCKAISETWLRRSLRIKGGKPRCSVPPRNRTSTTRQETTLTLNGVFIVRSKEKDVTKRSYLVRSLALQLMRSDPERALEVAKKIDDQDLRAQTEDDVYLVLMRQACSRRADAEARSIAVKFNDLSRRARWLVQIAGSLSPRSKENTEAVELLSEAHSIATKTENVPAKIEVLLLIAKEFLRIDQERGFEILSEAVSTTNRRKFRPN
jgi:hypothetical protein